MFINKNNLTGKKNICRKNKLCDQISYIILQCNAYILSFFINFDSRLYFRFSSHTMFDDCGFPIYKRRDTNITVMKGSILLDNQNCVPYNRDLLVMFQCHINIEWCNHSRSLKYLFKYCLKGYDRATMLLTRKTESQGSSIPRVTDNCVDEIKSYLDGRYISASEAVWRIFAFDVHFRNPAVERLPFHLENKQACTYNESEDLQNVELRAKFRPTKFLAWFDANKRFEHAKSLTYPEFPQHFVWNDGRNEWTQRKQGYTIGRLSHTTANAGEIWYLRMLLTRSKGATSFTDLRTINGTTYSSFKETCNALGLIDNDNEWHEAIRENAISASANQLRNLFVHIIANCQVSDPRTLWNEHWESMSDDILYNRRKMVRNNSLTMSSKQIQNYALAGTNQFFYNINWIYFRIHVFFFLIMAYVSVVFFFCDRLLICN